MKKNKKKSKWQMKREKQASENSQFDPKIHQLGREGFGFQMKKDVKIKATLNLSDLRWFVQAALLLGTIRTDSLADLVDHMCYEPESRMRADSASN